MLSATMRSGEWGARVADASKVFRPEGPGPFPVALILHGCGGKTPFLETYAQVAVEAGWAAVVVDSFAPRKISPLRAKLTVCTGTRLQGLERSGDIFAMLAWLEDQPWADAERVFLAGWSHGGWAIMDGYAIGPNAARATGVVDADPLKLRARVKGALLVYPYAAYPSLTSSQASMAKMSPDRWRPRSVVPVQTVSLARRGEIPRGAKLSTTTAAQPASTATLA